MECGLHSFLSPLTVTSRKLRGEFGGGESGANDDQATRLWALLLTKFRGHETKVLFLALASEIYLLRKSYIEESCQSGT